MADFFAPGALIRRVTAEPAPFFGAGRALLLQIAHPSVAQGVADHSEFQANPFKRLNGTLEGTYGVVFGSEELASAIGARIRRIHDHVTGPTYQANDPDLLLWVHATLIDTAIGRYERLIRPLTPSQAESLYADAMRVAEVFGCPRDAQPPTYADFRDYFAKTVAELEVADVGRQLARDIVQPELPIIPRPVRPALTPPLALFRLLTIGTLPASLREQFGFDWSAEQQQRLDRFEAWTARVLQATPCLVRVAPGWLFGRYLLRRAGRRR